MKILIIDDEFVSLMKLTSILDEYGDCIHATHGKQSVEIFNKALKEQAPFTVIFIDIYLPDILGTKLLSYLNSKEKKAKIKPSKKIIITAKSSLQNVKEATRNHCDAFLVKPIKKDALLKRLAEIGVIELEQEEEKEVIDTPFGEIEDTESFNLLDEAKELEPPEDEETEKKDKKEKKSEKKDDIFEELIPPVEKERLKKEIREEKDELFSLCQKDRIMLRYYDAIIEEEIEERWNEQKTNNSRETEQD